MKTINQVVKDQQIEVVHLLTEDTSLAFFLPMLQRRTKVFYTVHDLFAHEKVYKNTLIRLLRKVLVEYRVNYIIRRSHNLVTCSYAQYELMKSIFPNKNVCFHNFPSLITASVKSGNTVIPELHGITDYLLFFGQVEQYKGVHILYNTYLRYADEIKRPLVIAGKGHIYFKREVAKEGQVIFINRYIADEEIKCLFSQAYCSIFPYISGTQSGILSLPYFFKIPSIVSDIPFFESMTVNNVTSLSFGLNDPASLVKRINELDDLSIEELKNSGYLYYEKNYDSKALRSQLVEIYHPQSG
nr:glycosyltransferase family 4 protein [Mucilaginibacter sp. SP1R1]MBB6148316.1 glycosyltransferase involved in cell wall biosynthesis [Mucilaginibacter sp. SP1R1]